MSDEQERLFQALSSVLSNQDKSQRKRDQKYAHKTAKEQPHGSPVDLIFKPPLGAFKGPTPTVAIDCEMVQTEGNRNALARASIVNYNGHVVYDKYIKPSARVTDYRTWVSGIQPHMLKTENGAVPEQEARKEIFKILNQAQKIVGHSVQHDFDCLGFQIYNEAEKANKVRDVAKYAKYKSENGQI
jgi:DNA polymerase III epsilon subunit-like protein